MISCFIDICSCRKLQLNADMFWYVDDKISKIFSQLKRYLLLQFVPRRITCTVHTDTPSVNRIVTQKSSHHLIFSLTYRFENEIFRINVSSRRVISGPLPDRPATDAVPVDRTNRPSVSVTRAGEGDTCRCRRVAARVCWHVDDMSPEGGGHLHGHITHRSTSADMAGREWGRPGRSDRRPIIHERYSWVQ